MRKGALPSAEAAAVSALLLNAPKKDCIISFRKTRPPTQRNSVHTLVMAPLLAADQNFLRWRKCTEPTRTEIACLPHRRWCFLPAPAEVIEEERSALNKKSHAFLTSHWRMPCLQEIAPAEVMEEEGEARKKGKHARTEGAANVPKADEEVEDED